MKKAQKNFNERINDLDSKVNNTKFSNKKGKDNDGEYIDYEEIK